MQEQKELLCLNNLNFIQIGKLEIEEDNVESLLATACMLQLDKVRDYCCSFLMKELHLSNCIGIRKFAALHCCNELYEAATNFFMVRIFYLSVRKLLVLCFLCPIGSFY